MIHLGVRAHDYGKDDPERLFGRIHADGFESVQLAFKKAVSGVNDFRDITPEVVAKAGAAAKRNSIRIAVLGVYIEPSLVDEDARKKNMAEFIGSIPFAKALGADCIGTETTRMETQPHAAREDALRALLRSLESAMPAAEENGVTVAIEPVASHTMNTPECAASVLKDIASPNLKVIFDPVNLLTEKNLPAQDALWDRFFDLLGDKIAAVHMKGTRVVPGGTLGRCGFADSQVNYPRIFRALRQLPGDFSVLREEIDPEHAEEDRRFLHALASGR